MPLRDSGISAQQPVGLSCSHSSSSFTTVFPFHNSFYPFTSSFILLPCSLIHLLLSPSFSLLSLLLLLLAPTAQSSGSCPRHWLWLLIAETSFYHFFPPSQFFKGVLTLSESPAPCLCSRRSPWSTAPTCTACWRRASWWSARRAVPIQQWQILPRRGHARDVKSWWLRGHPLITW